MRKPPSFFRGPRSGRPLLTTTEQQELTRLLKDNGAALEARRTASQQLHLAGVALNEKRQADAVELLKRVAVNEQYLTAADRQTFRQCSVGLLPGVAAPGADAARPANGDPVIQARALVRQARAHLIQGDFDLADKEAHEAVALKVAFARNEDSPAWVLNDLAKVRHRRQRPAQGVPQRPGPQGLRPGRAVRPSVGKGQRRLVDDPVGRHAGQGAHRHRSRPQGRFERERRPARPDSERERHPTRPDSARTRPGSPLRAWCRPPPSRTPSRASFRRSPRRPPPRPRTTRTPRRPASCWPRPARPSTPATSSRCASSSTRPAR